MEYGGLTNTNRKVLDLGEHESSIKFDETICESVY